MMGWPINVEGLFNQIKFVGERYGKPMMITAIFYRDAIKNSQPRAG